MAFEKQNLGNILREEAEKIPPNKKVLNNIIEQLWKDKEPLRDDYLDDKKPEVPTTPFVGEPLRSDYLDDKKPETHTEAFVGEPLRSNYLDDEIPNIPSQEEEYDEIPITGSVEEAEYEEMPNIGEEEIGNPEIEDELEL